MKTNLKFNPSNIQNNYTGSEDNDLENLPFKDQVKLYHFNFKINKSNNVF
jgi:hypothetical protein